MPIYYAQIGDDEYAFEVLETGGATVVTPVTIASDAEAESAFSVDLAAVHNNTVTGEGLYSLIIRNRSYQLYVERADEGFRVLIWRHRFPVRVLTEREWRLQKVAPKHAANSGVLVVSAPMPGLVKTVVVAEGEEVAAGARLIVLEAMKMENDIVAPRAGRASRIHVQPGTIVDAGKPLVTLE